MRTTHEDARWALEKIAARAIALLDEMDAPAEDLEPTGDDEPSFGWSHHEAMFGRYGGGPDEGEEDDPAEDSDADEDSDPGEDGHDAEADVYGDANLTRPETAEGFARIATGEEEMRLREAFDPRLARRPPGGCEIEYWRRPMPTFPHEPDRSPLNMQDEMRRIRMEIGRLRLLRHDVKRKREAKRRRFDARR